MPKLKLEETLLPILYERAREKRKEAARQNRVSEISGYYQTLFPEADEKKVEAAAGLTSFGASVSQKVFAGTGQDGPPADAIDALAKAGNWPESVKKLAIGGYLTVPQAFQIGAKLGEPPVLSDENIKLTLYGLEKLGVKEAGDLTEKDIEAFYAIIDLLGAYGKRAIYDKYIPKQETVPTFVKKVEYINKLVRDEDGNLIQPEKVLRNPNKMLAMQALDLDTDALYRAYGTSFVTVSKAKSLIEDEVRNSSVKAIAGWNELLLKWVTGNDEDIPESTKKVFEKYYDKRTGEIREGAAIEYASRITDEGLGLFIGDEYKKVPKSIRQLVLDIIKTGKPKEEILRKYYVKSLMGSKNNSSQLSENDPLSFLMDYTEEEIKEALKYVPDDEQ